MTVARLSASPREQIAATSSDAPSTHPETDPTVGCGGCGLHRTSSQQRFASLQQRALTFSRAGRSRAFRQLAVSAKGLARRPVVNFCPSWPAQLNDEY
ncbi:hypothetical protein MTO96_006578 [Rhipicephalus appendiculatus]